MPYSPLILFWIKGLLLSRHTPEFPAFLGFLICVRENAPPSHSKRTQAIPAGVRGGCGTKYDFRALQPQNWSDYRQLYNGFHEYFQGSIFKREKGSASNALPDSQRTAEPTAFSRVLTAFARFFAHIGWKKAVCQAHVSSRNRCVSHTKDSAKQADFSPVCGCFPCVRYTHKKINISATKGVVFVSGEPWVGSPWTPNVNYTRERIYRKTEKEQQRGCLYFRCTANRFPSAPTGISRSGFLFLLFLCPKKDFAKDIFWFDYQS